MIKPTGKGEAEVQILGSSSYPIDLRFNGVNVYPTATGITFLISDKAVATAYLDGVEILGDSISKPFGTYTLKVVYDPEP